MAFNEQPSNPKADTSADDGAAANGTISARQLIDESKRHFALKEYAASIDKVAQALEQLSSEYAEDANELAPVLHHYGRSLLENFIINSAALGGGGGCAPLPAPSAPSASASAASGSSFKPSGSGSGSSSSAAAAVKRDPRFSFSGDAEDDDDDEEEEGAPGAAGAEDDDDDLQVAFSVLDLARVIYQRILDSESPRLTTLDGQEWDKTRIQAELAEVMNDLGDVGLEAENFSQASADYRSSLEILTPLLLPHSRRLADAHLRLGLALEFHPEIEQRKGAKSHVQSASDVLGKRITAIQSRIDKSSPETAEAATEGKEKDDLANLSESALQKQLEEMQGMKNEIDTKLEEYDTEDGQAQLNGEPDLTGVLGLPADAAAKAKGGMTTKDALQQAIKDAFLGARAQDGGEGLNPFTAAAAKSSDAPVNNLSSMVKRKKKPEAEAETEANGEAEAKKARTEA